MVGDRATLNSDGINAGCRRIGSRSGVIASEVKSRGGCTIIWDGSKAPKAVMADYLEHETDTGSVT